jgi:hypothetical protein
MKWTAPWGINATELVAIIAMSKITDAIDSPLGKQFSLISGDCCHYE